MLAGLGGGVTGLDTGVALVWAGRLGLAVVAENGNGEMTLPKIKSEKLKTNLQTSLMFQ